jgi:hypothetical protein
MNAIETQMVNAILLMEDALLRYRLLIAPEREVFCLDCATEEQMKNIMRQFWRK